MTSCEYCSNIGQWRMRWITRYPLTDAEKKQRLHQRGPLFEVGPLVCNDHKESLMKQPSDREFGFVFIGAAVGAANSGH